MTERVDTRPTILYSNETCSCVDCKKGVDKGFIACGFFNHNKNAYNWKCLQCVKVPELKMMFNDCEKHSHGKDMQAKLSCIRGFDTLLHNDQEYIHCLFECLEKNKLSDQGAGKIPPNSWRLFVMDNLSKIKMQYPDKSPHELMEECNLAWDKLDEETKQSYKDRAPGEVEHLKGHGFMGLCESIEKVAHDVGTRLGLTCDKPATSTDSTYQGRGSQSFQEAMKSGLRPDRTLQELDYPELGTTVHQWTGPEI